MSTLAILNDLVPVFTALGVVGLVVAAGAGVTIAFGLWARHSTTVGLGVCSWIAGALLSCALLFAGDWLLVAVAGAALPAGLVLGAAAQAAGRRDSGDEDAVLEDGAPVVSYG